jgi:hypothetical protein
MGAKMREAKLATFLAAGLTLLSAVAYAGSAPKELYGKSITVAWSEARTMKFESEQLVRNTGTAVQMNIYISTSGRPFVRSLATVSPAMVTTSNWAVGLRPSRKPLRVKQPQKTTSTSRDARLLCGARRVSIVLDGTTCKATVVNGREGGKNIKQYSNRFGGAEVLSVQVGAVSCSVREGNVFG